MQGGLAAELIAFSGYSRLSLWQHLFVFQNTVRPRHGEGAETNWNHTHPLTPHRRSDMGHFFLFRFPSCNTRLYASHPLASLKLLDYQQPTVPDKSGLLNY